MTAASTKIELVGGALCGAVVDWPVGSNQASFHVRGVDYTYCLTLASPMKGILVSQQ